MKRNLTLIVTAVLPSLVLIAALSVLLFQGASAAESKPRIVSVDYVLALMDAGIDQKDIVRRIEEKNLAFRLAPGDIDRLREAGAGKHLIEVVTAEGVVLENHQGVPTDATPPPQNQGGTDASQWGRPSRLAGEEQGKPEGGGQQPEAGDNGEGIKEEPYSGYVAYPGYDYWSGYYGFVYSYGYPYSYPYSYYPGYYYPYRSYYYSAPYSTYPYRSYRTAPRGSGSSYGAPHGGGGSPRSSPRGSHHH